LLGYRQKAGPPLDNAFDAVLEQDTACLRDRYEELNQQYDTINYLIYADLREQLARGELMARGFR
jgi:hypothetical protein